MNQKPFKTHDELIEILKSRGEKDILKVLGFPDNWKQLLLHTHAL